MAGRTDAGTDRAFPLQWVTVLAVAFGLAATLLSAWRASETPDEPVHLEWSRRLTFLAMRSVEWEFQQSLPYRSQIVAAVHPDQLEDIIRGLKQEQAALTHTPTPGPNRVAQLVTAARGIVGKTQGANLANVVPR